MKRNLDRAVFFSALRKKDSGVFGTALSQGQVSGCEILLDVALERNVPLNYAAYCLATTYLETAHTMQPIYERGKKSYFNKYEPGTKLGKALGNTVVGDGYLFRGRGYVQLTGRRNYTLASKKLGIDLVANPDLALEPEIAAKILFIGMDEGWFTGKSLSDYIDDIDEDDDEDLREFINARRIVNGTDKAREIGEYALAFENALRLAGYDEEVPVPVPAPAPVPVPVPAPVPKPIPTPETITGELAKPNSQSKVIWAAIGSGALGVGQAINAALSGLDWRVAIGIIVLIGIAGGVIIFERMRYSKKARGVIERSLTEDVTNE